jgi:tetratricopeptide (TPR) repeat protein
MPIPDLVPLAAPQADTLTAAPQADTLTAAPQADTPAAAPQADTLTAAPQADTSAAAPTEASIARTAMPEAPDARPALMPSHGSRVAQNIFRAKQPANNKSRTRVIVLAGVAVALVLATAVGGIFLGVLGDPRMLAQNMDLAVPPSLALPPVSLTAPVPEAEPTASPDARGTSASDTATAPPVANAARPTSRAAVPVGSSGHKPSRPSIPPVKPASSLACPPGTLPPDCKSNVKIRSSGPSILELGYSALTQELLPEAEKFYLRALDNNPEERDALLGLAYIAHKQGRQDDALRHYRRVLRQEPGNVVARAGLLALNSLSDPQDFVSQSRVLAEQNPASAAAQATLGHALVRQDRLADAQLAFSRALQLEPGVARHAFNLAVALDRLHDYEAAQRYYERAVALLAQSGGERANGFALADVQLRLAQLRSAE